MHTRVCVCMTQAKPTTVIAERGVGRRVSCESAECACNGDVTTATAADTTTTTTTAQLLGGFLVVNWPRHFGQRAGAQTAAEVVAFCRPIPLARRFIVTAGGGGLRAKCTAHTCTYTYGTVRQTSEQQSCDGPHLRRPFRAFVADGRPNAGRRSGRGRHGRHTYR